MWNLFKGIVFILALIGTYKVWQEGNYLTNFLHFYGQIFNGTFLSQIQQWSDNQPLLQNLKYYTEQLPSLDEIKNFLHLT
ncbi:hypothetical protein [Staphylococcus simulans]|uniref:Uncharacterized protein n=1 Tax=Staphylococcus simulans TaxID=1286 RepID=A0A6N3BPJ8_STASI|nr:MULTISPECIES: hypothetical protein [Staphylococcus]MBO0387893.1 hypothetical protein [Staphylococcus simulans]MBU6944663.1 hypothetical protein [Staphylococcus sp. CWZ226]MDQ7115937.1 hypothetical protein [Staphylococcus simulans]MDQ7139346.1 hypothetical protein [Staphylococcus simulans]WML97096.1 hypothetical protein RCG53_10640 [Staphylococcus simulans]